MGIIHDRLANTIVLYVLILALWGFWRFFRKRGVDSSFWGSLVIAEVLILTQGVLGFFLWLSGLTPTRGWVHILYGIVGAISIPAVFIFSKGRDDRRDVLVYAAVHLFQVGVFLRAMMTGGGV